MHRQAAVLCLVASAFAFRGPAARRAAITRRPAGLEAIFEQKKGGAALSREAKAILKKGEAHLKKVNELEATYDGKSDAELRAEASALKAELQTLKSDEEADEATAAKVFALAREAAWRVLQLRAYDVQILGGHAMATGALAEMATGEGKTLAAVAPTLLGALRGRGALLVTSNDYLARRDADSVGLVFRFLGLSVGLVEATMTPASEERRGAYACDVTYVSNAEIGFDYLRDQLALDGEDLVLPQREKDIEDLFWWCLVDEADSILIDEARTPLIISETTEAPAAKYSVARDLAEGVLREGLHYDVDLKGRSVTLNENGYAEAENALGKTIFDAKDPWAPFLLSALRAKELLEKDRDYMVDGQDVKLVDAFSGRVLEGRRYADGLQQAVEAQENLPCSNQTRPSAQVTFQSLFRTVPTRLAGMTGTASSDAKELQDVYDLTVVPIPTALPIARKDYDDAVYQTIDAKNRAAAAEVARQHKEGRPVLVGTTSVDASDAFLARLKRDYGLEAEVLSARPDAAKREGAVVAQAGRLGAVTVATNMAGRGTDIKLGGSARDLARLYVEECLRGGDGAGLLNVRGQESSLVIAPATHDAVAAARAGAAELLQEDLDDGVADLVALAADGRAVSRAPAVLKARAAIDAVVADVGDVLKAEKAQVAALGGLYVVGTERHESVRVDDQLRGRAGRQGDAGASRFFVSVKDAMFVNFGGERIADMMQTFRVGDDLPVEAKTVTDALSKIQAKVEAFNAEQRTNVLKFDDVQDGQRRALYATRRRLLLAGPDDAAATFARWVADAILATAQSVDRDAAPGDDPDALLAARLAQFFGPGLALDEPARAALQQKDAAALAAAPAVAALASDLLARVAAARPARPAAESFTKVALLRLDGLWAEHLLNMNYLKENVQLRTLQQTDPFQEYQREGYDLFQALQTRIRADAVYSMVQMARG